MGLDALAGNGELDISNPSKSLGVVGFYICVIGLASYTVKERFFVSDALIALLVGIAVGPVGLDWISIQQWTEDSPEVQEELIYELTRIVLGIQVLFTGISLPKAYLKKSWWALAVLLLPVMTLAWLVSSAIIFAFIPHLTFLEALVIGAALAPTDPVLAASVVKGRFAEKYVPKVVRDLIAAESGANDGAAYPFIYLPLFLIERRELAQGVGWSIKTWFVQAIFYDVLLSVACGAIIGFVARKTLKYARTNQHIDHENFLAYGMGLAFLTLGVVGTLGSDDILACFICGNSVTWDDFFRLETEDHSFQDVIDVLLDSAIFILIGTLIPWARFVDASMDLAFWRFVVIGIMILFFRRLPWVMATYRAIPELRNYKEALFTGWFGPIGVGAIYYAQVALRELPESRGRLREMVEPVIYFVVLCSVIFHGLSIPLFKIGGKGIERTRSLGTNSQTRIKTLDHMVVDDPDNPENDTQSHHSSDDTAAEDQQAVTQKKDLDHADASEQERNVTREDDLEANANGLHQGNDGHTTPQRVAFKDV